MNYVITAVNTRKAKARARAHADLADEERLVGGGVAHVRPDGLSARALLFGAVELRLQRADRVRVAEDLVLASLQYTYRYEYSTANALIVRVRKYVERNTVPYTSRQCMCLSTTYFG